MDSDTNDDVIPVACTLTAKAAAGQALEWVDLQHRAIELVALDTGARITLPASMRASVEDLVQRERVCCSFLDISTSVDGEVLTVAISSRNTDALPVIAALTGVEER